MKRKKQAEALANDIVSNIKAMSFPPITTNFPWAFQALDNLLYSGTVEATSPGEVTMQNSSGTVTAVLRSSTSPEGQLTWEARVTVKRKTVTLHTRVGCLTDAA